MIFTNFFLIEEDFGNFSVDIIKIDRGKIFDY